MLAAVVATAMAVAGTASLILMGVNFVISSYYDPEGEAAKELTARNEANQRQALFELGVEQQREERKQKVKARAAQAFGQGGIAEMTFIGKGMRDPAEVPDNSYLRTISEKMSMDPEALTRRLDPRHLGPTNVRRIK